MDIRSSLDGLKGLLGVTPASPSSTQRVKAGPAAEGSSIPSDRATLSSAGSEVALSAADGGVRMDKVAAIQAALAGGTYNVPSLEVASSMVDSMLQRAN